MFARRFFLSILVSIIYSLKMNFYYTLLLVCLLIVPAFIVNRRLIKKQKERATRYPEFLNKFHLAVKHQNYPGMVKYGRAMLYNQEIITSDLIEMEKLVKKHALNYPELADFELEIFQKRALWDSPRVK